MPSTDHRRHLGTVRQYAAERNRTGTAQQRLGRRRGGRRQRAQHVAARYRHRSVRVGASDRARGPASRGVAVVAVDAAPSSQAPRSRGRRRQTGGSDRCQRAGLRADRRARRPVEVHRGGRRQRGAHQRRRVGARRRGVRHRPDRTVQPRGDQREDDAFAGVQRAPDSRRRRSRAAAAATRPADPGGRRRGQGRPRTGGPERRVRTATRSGDQRPDPAGRHDPADGRPHRADRAVGADPERPAHPILRDRTVVGGRQR